MPKTVKVAEVTELGPGERKMVEVEGVSLALFNGRDVFFDRERVFTRWWVARRRRASWQRSHMPFARRAVRRFFRQGSWPSCSERRQKLCRHGRRE